MVSHSVDPKNEPWIKTGNLVVHLPSMEKGFREIERYRQEIWDSIQYRESLVKWSMTNEEMRAKYKNGTEPLDERKN